MAASFGDGRQLGLQIASKGEEKWKRGACKTRTKRSGGRVCREVERSDLNVAQGGTLRLG